MAGLLGRLFAAPAGPVNTGTTTQFGRPIWKGPNGETFSEKTTTVRAHDGSWYNVPTIGPNGVQLSADIIQRVALSPTWAPVDQITKAKLKPFKSLEQAVDAAMARTRGMKIMTPGGLKEY